MPDPSIYTDGAGSYFQPGSVSAQDPTKTDVNVRTASFYTTQSMATSSLPLAGWTVAVGLSDIGGGVWISGALVDPPAAAAGFEPVT